MKATDLYQLLYLIASKQKNAEVEELLNSMRREERITLAAALTEGASYLHRYNKTWDEALNFPDKNEE